MVSKKQAREEINKKLSEYTEKNCMHCYAQVTERGRIHLDDRFEMKHLKDIMGILKDLAI